MTQSVHPPAQPSAQVPTTDAPPAGASPSNNRGGKSTVSAASRWATFSHAVAFVVGFTIVFVLMGSAFGLLGANLQGYKGIISQLGAVLLLLFALVTMGVFGWAARTLTARVDLAANPAAAALVGILNWFNQLVYSERRVAGMHSVHHGWGLLSSFLIGVTFSAGWLPCIGPILSSILFLAGSSTTAAQGASLLLVYSLGLGIPFLLAGLFLGSLTPFLRRLNRHANVISIVSGIFLLYVAYLLWTNQLAQLTTQFAFLNDFVIGVEDRVSEAAGMGGRLASMSTLSMYALAFFAGLLSFISPCVLPLVPGYVGMLASVSVGQQGTKQSV